MSYVYVITDEGIDESPNGYLTKTNFVKIGFTGNDVDQRIAQLQTGNPRELHLLYVYEFENSEMAKIVERLMHWNLKPHRVSGEWFEYNREVYAKLKTLQELSNFESHTCPDEEFLEEAQRLYRFEQSQKATNG